MSVGRPEPEASTAVQLLPGDIVLTRSGGIVGWAIRTFTRHVGESRTEATHCAVVVMGGVLHNAVIVEALSSVRKHALRERYMGSRHYVSVFRPLQLDDGQIRRIVAKAESYVGRRYGYLKLLAHWADWLLQGAYVFRRLASEDRYPICSWVVAHAFAAAGTHFDVEPGAATPDDIWDFVGEHPDRFAPVLPPSRLTGE